MLIFLMLTVLEIGLTVWRLKKYPNLSLITLFLRSFSLIILLILAWLSIITWGWRYYAIAIVLVILVIVSLLRVMLLKNDLPRMKHLRIITKGLGMLLLLFLFASPAILFPEYKFMELTGEYQIDTSIRYLIDESRTETYENDGRARRLVVEFWYPMGTTERFPLVVFSHGSFGTRTSNETLFRELASHGYVVGSIDHTYQCLYTSDEKGNLLIMNNEYFREIVKENAKDNKENSYQLYQKWMDVRVSDINYVIDTIKEGYSDPIYDLVETGKIGVIGHSLGGSAALGVGRLRNDIGAVVALESPYMVDIIGVENNEFIFETAEYPVPVLNIYSDSLWSNLDQWPQYAKNAELLLGLDQDTFNIYLNGTGHLSLTDLSLASPILTRILNGHSTKVKARDCLQVINSECLAFFDSFLKGGTVYQ